MALKPEDQVKMFGCTLATIDLDYSESLSVRAGDPAMYLMSILSDVQEVMARGDTETARQWINKVKYLLGEKIRSKREVRDILEDQGDRNLPLFYVPAVLVVRAASLDDADGHAETILSQLGNHLAGFTLFTEADATPASPDWADKHQVLTPVEDRFMVREVPYEAA